MKSPCGKQFLCRLAHVASIAVACAFPLAGHAQDYPSRPITIIVAYPPGSATDNLMRPLANALQPVLGQPVVIENKPGAQGLLGTEFGARAKPDGYTLTAGSTTTLAASVGLFKKLSYDPLKDFLPVAGVGSTSQMFMVRADSAAKDLAGFVALARKDPNPLPVGVGGSSAQVAWALLSKVTGTKFLPVAYKGTPQALTDLIGGTIPMAVVDVGNAVPHINSGRLVALASSAAVRGVAAPAVPTLAETYPNVELVTWIGLVAPAGTPGAIVDKLYTAIAKAVSTPDMKAKYAAISTEVDLVAPAEFGKRMQRDQARWLELIKAAGIEPE